MYNKNRISEVGLKLQLDDLRANAERFKSLDEEILPIELDSRRDSYQYILQKLAAKCSHAVKNKHFADKYHEQINHEIEAITHLAQEIDEFENACHQEYERGKNFINQIKTFGPGFINFLEAQEDGPRDIQLAFKAFLNLGPKGTEGGADLSWKAIKYLLADLNRLADMMRDMLDNRINDVSRAEVDASADCMRHLTKEYSLILPAHCQVIAKVMANYIDACLSIWDMRNAIQARSEMQQLKKDKMEYLRQEYYTYMEIANLYESEIDDLYKKYHKSKDEYLTLKKEVQEADNLLHNFEEHFKAVQSEKGKEQRNYKKISELLDQMKNDCHEFEKARLKIQTTLPAEAKVA